MWMYVVGISLIYVTDQLSVIAVAVVVVVINVRSLLERQNTEFERILTESQKISFCGAHRPSVDRESASPGVRRPHTRDQRATTAIQSGCGDLVT